MTELLEGTHGALGVGVEAAEALDGVGEELDPDRLVAIGRKDVEDSPSPRHLARAGHGILTDVASFVQGLEEDLRGHLLAGTEVDARGSPAGAGPGSAEADPAGEATIARRVPLPAASRVAARRADASTWRGSRRKGGGPGAGKAATAPSRPASAASVRRSWAVSSTSRSRGDHHEKRGFGDQERHQTLRTRRRGRRDRRAPRVGEGGLGLARTSSAPRGASQPRRLVVTVVGCARRECWWSGGARLHPYDAAPGRLHLPAARRSRRPPSRRP